MLLRVGYAQFDCRFGNKASNIDTMEKVVGASRLNLLVFPEMCTTGYMVQGRAELVGLAEPLSGPTVEAVIAMARRTDSLIVFGMAEEDEGKIFSSAIAVSREGVLAKHQKTHLFLRENLYFSPGTTPPRLFEWNGVKIGLGVCYDYMFPEYWRVLGLGGADIFCNTANFVYEYGFKMMQARSIENGVFSICTNRTGAERGSLFNGGSEIVDPRGNILRRAGAGEESSVVEIDPLQARDKRWNPYNDLFKDRRPEMYG